MEQLRQQYAHYPESVRAAMALGGDGSGPASGVDGAPPGLGTYARDLLVNSTKCTGPYSPSTRRMAIPSILRGQPATQRLQLGRLAFPNSDTLGDGAGRGSSRSRVLPHRSLVDTTGG